MEEIHGGLVNKRIDVTFSSYKSVLYLRLNKKNQKNLLSNIKLINFAVLILHRGVFRGAEVF